MIYAVPAEQAKPKSGPEKMLAGMPEKSLHKMFSYGDPIVYAATVVGGSLLIRTGHTCIAFARKSDHFLYLENPRCPFTHLVT